MSNLLLPRSTANCNSDNSLTRRKFIGNVVLAATGAFLMPAGKTPRWQIEKQS